MLIAGSPIPAGWRCSSALPPFVTEMGGELSHTMIVSRDLGIPAVVGAVGATSSIATGDLVEVDGSAGIVRIIERA